MPDIDVAIVGGGISGLSAARTLCEHGLRVRLFEREAACGGVIQTEHVDGFVIDSGPDTLLAHKPAALALVRELGLDDRLVAPLPNRTTYVLRRTALRSLPEMSALGLPTSWRTLAAATAFSWRGKLRMAAEPLIPAAAPIDDESIAGFVRRRFGREAVTRVAEPLLAGLHRGDAARLSIRALFPTLANAERTHGSVARAWRRASRGGGGSMSLRDGLAEIAARLQAQLPPQVPVTGTEVAWIERNGSYTLGLRDGTTITSRAVLLATPAYVTAALTAELDVRLARLCGTIRFAPSLTVALGYRRDRIRHDLGGWGFVVPASERRRIRSATWVSSKWPGRAPAGHALIRVSLDGAGQAEPDAPNETLAARAHEELRALLGITGDPVVARVYRRARAMPQLEMGHLERMAAIDRRLASVPGLFVSASGFRGVGLPDCIKDARAVAERAAAYVR
ncbi:MAG TPA: protoporphyrinogen oxidase [Vicinamibacterales bacterium]|nr:protoporphyrinogen oxidase [Vicinamibacterales bacterium]